MLIPADPARASGRENKARISLTREGNLANACPRLYLERSRQKPPLVVFSNFAQSTILTVRYKRGDFERSIAHTQSNHPSDRKS